MMFLALLLCMSLNCVSNAVPLAKRIVDMTHTFDETTLHFPTTKEFKLNMLLNGTKDFGQDTGVWVQYEEYSSDIHVGTHMDAPAHFAKGGATVDQIPFTSLIAPAAVIDITAKAESDPEAEATVDDLLSWETVTGQSLNETIVLLKAGWGRKWNDQAAFFGNPDNDPNNLHFPGLGAEAARWLVENRNIYGYGSETVSLDKGNALNYPVHQILLPHGIFGMENVANVDKIPIYGAKLYVFPMKVGKGSGAPVRIIAVFPEITF